MKQIADEIKTALPMQAVAEHYGFPVPASGFIRCPFHQGDRQASLKIYAGQGGFHCFGCNAGGSVIDFVMLLFGLNFKQALLRLNADFRLSLTSGRPDRAARSAALEARRREMQLDAQAQVDYLAACKEEQYCKDVLKLFTPVQKDGKVFYHPLYVEAVKRLPVLSNWLDEYLEGRGKDTWKQYLASAKTTI